jgi:tRNA (cmo5U34)-methyltransferase
VTQFHFDPETYLDLMAEEVPDFERLQTEVAAASAGLPVGAMLELGTGTGETARRVLPLHPGAHLVGLDASEAMLRRAREVVPAADLRVARIEDPLPEGPFDLVFSALAVHHLDGPGKADLFRRVAGLLRAGGRFVLGDVVVPQDAGDLVTPIDGVYDRPSRVDEQLTWLAEAGFSPRLVWAQKDLAVMTADLPD